MQDPGKLFGHLPDSEILDLMKYCIDQKGLFTAKDVSVGCHNSTLSRWMKGTTKKSKASTKTSRQYLECYFASAADKYALLPAKFKSPTREEEIDTLEPPPSRSTSSSNSAPSISTSSSNYSSTGISACSSNAMSGINSIHGTQNAPSADDDDSEYHSCDEPRERRGGTGPALRICSWNLRNLGKATPSDRKSRIALLLGQQKIAAVQEIRCSELWAELVAAGSSVVMPRHRFVQSDLSGERTRRKEALGFFYDAQIVEVVHTRTFASDDTSTNTTDLRYHPFAATFCLRQGAVRNKFTILNVHVRYGTTGSNVDQEGMREEEVNAIIGIYRWMQRHGDSFGTEIYICGDFNLVPRNSVFRKMRTTLGLREGFASRNGTTVAKESKCYDNFLVPNNSVLVDFDSFQVLRLDDMVDITNKESREHFVRSVSDHLPVVMELVVPLESPVVSLVSPAVVSLDSPITSFNSFVRSSDSPVKK